MNHYDWVFQHNLRLTSERKAELRAVGDKESLELLFRSHLAQVLRIVTTLCQQKTYLDFDEVFQCGCIGLMRSISTWDPSIAELSTYAHRGILSHCLNVNRQSIRRFKHGEVTLDIDSLEISDHHDCPATAAEDTESERETLRLSKRCLEIARNYCGERNAQLLWDRVNGKTLRQIGDELGISKERVRQLEAKTIRTILEVLASETT